MSGGRPGRARGGAAGEFFAGAWDVWRGAGLLLRRPAWWPLAIIPFVLNCVLLGAALWLGAAPLKHYVTAHFMNANAWWAALGWLLSIALWLAMLLAVFFLFVPVATIVAAPFNDFLSEKVEQDYCGALVEKKGFLADTWKALWIGLKSSVKLSLITLALILLILPVHFIPVAGSVAYTILSIAITIRFLSLQFTAYSMDRRFYEYRQRADFLKRNRWRTIGLGAMAALVMWIPGLNALFIPVSAVAGTLLFCDTELKN